MSTKLLVENMSSRTRCSLVFSSDDKARARAEEEGTTPDIVPLVEYSNDKLREEKGLLDEVVIGGKLMPYVFRARRYIKQQDVDLVHVNDGLTAVVWGIAAKTGGVPVIWHIRSEERIKIWDRVRLALSDHLIFVAETNKRRFDWMDIDKKRNTVVHNGVDVNEYSGDVGTDLREELDLPPESLLVGFIGHLLDRKRPLLFAKSAVEVLKERDDVHFVIAGDDYDQYSERICDVFRQENELKHLYMLGYRSDVPRIMNSLDLLAVTSTEYGEAFPRVPLEAMASGTPVVSTDTAGVSEAIIDQEVGVLLGVNPSPRELGAQMLSLLNDPQRLRTMGQNAKTHVRTNFSAQQCAERVERVYDEILGS